MHHPTPTTGTEAAVPMLRLSGFYFAYYAALGAFTPYWSAYTNHYDQLGQSDLTTTGVLISKAS